MPYDLLKQVIAYIKKNSPCQSCKTSLHDEDIFVMSTTACPENNSCYGIFAIICPQCNAEGCLLIEANENRPYESISGREHAAISVNEVLDMHNFLKRWKGDVKELFKE